jgi:hypothetical protein
MLIGVVGLHQLINWSGKADPDGPQMGPLTGHLTEPHEGSKQRSVASYSSTVEEKKKALLPTNSTASLKKIRPPDAPTREGRLLTGNLGYDAFRDEALELPMKNRPARDWQGKALENLLKFQRPSTKVILAPTEQLILVVKGEGRYVEEVNVSYLFEDGHRTGFNALIDSQSGQVLNTWGQIIHEQRKKKVSLTPTNI